MQTPAITITSKASLMKQIGATPDTPVSQQSQRDAAAIKATDFEDGPTEEVQELLEEEDLPRGQRFGLEAAREHGWFDATQRISYTAIAEHADKEYANWRTSGFEADGYTATAYDSLKKWVHISADEHLLGLLLDTTPTGLAADPHTGVAYAFTPFQRLSMAIYVHAPYDLHAKLYLTADKIRDVCSEPYDRGARGVYHAQNPPSRTMPIAAECFLARGACRDIGIIDLPTGVGNKTAWTESVAFMLVGSRHFPRLEREHRDQAKGRITTTPLHAVARLVIVATAASTYHHFATTLKRLLPSFETLDPAVAVRVWVGKDRAYSTRAAAEYPPHVAVFWIMPITHLTEALRAHPNVAVAVGIVDEFIVDTPKQKYLTPQSPFKKLMIAQATPQALRNASRGNGSLLRDIFGGELHAPRSIRRSIKDRSWNEATMTARHLCMLEMMTVTPFRKLVRDDLRALIPPGLSVHVMRSRRFTYASHLLDVQVEMVPYDLTDTVVAYLSNGGFRIQADSLSELRASLVGALSAADFARILDTLQPASNSFGVAPNWQIVNRLKERLADFQSECPICASDGAELDMRMFGCCGYCVCTCCYGHIRNNRCPFCRTSLAVRQPVAEEDVVNDAERMYPAAPAAPIDLSQADAFRGNHQITNMMLALHHLRQDCARKRPLLIIEYRMTRGDLNINLDLLGQRIQGGGEFYRVDHLLRGRGDAFHQLKTTRFDTADPRMIGFVCYGASGEFLVGTNLDHVDCVVVVGNVKASLITQALGRIFRPRRERDNESDVPLIRIGCA